MTKIQDIEIFLGIKAFPKEDYAIFQKFKKHTLATKTQFSSSEQISNACKLLELPKEYHDTVQNELNKLNQNQELIFIANFLHFLLFVEKEPSENALYEPFNLSYFSSGSLRVLLLLNTLPDKFETLQKRNVPIETYQHNFSALSSNLLKNRNEKDIDVENFRWTTFQASLALFKLGYLTFNLYVFRNYFKVFRHNTTHEVLLLAKEKVCIRQDGQLDGVNDIWDQNAIKTVLYIGDQKIIGHRIKPTGHVELTPTIFPLSDYKQVIKKNDYLLEIHIPPVKGYTLENVYDSFEKAKNFFQTYFADYPVKGFWSLSWLYSPQLRELLSSEESNIIRIQDAVHLVPLKVSDATAYFFLFHKQTITPEEIKPTSILLTRLKEYLLSGKRINCGGMLFLLDDLPNFLSQIYKK